MCPDEKPKQKLFLERRDEEGKALIKVSGLIDEDADIRAAFLRPPPNVEVDLEGLHLINSRGVRNWIRAISSLPPTTTLRFSRCSPPFIEQANFLANFLGSGKIVSFFAPYVCRECRGENKMLLTPEQVPLSPKPSPPALPCPRCGAAMAFDDVSEEFFFFLKKV